MFAVAHHKKAGITLLLVFGRGGDDLDQEAMLVAVREAALCPHPHPIMVVCVEPGVPPPSAGWRKRFAEDSASYPRELLVVLVTSDPIARGVMTAVQWIRPFHYKTGTHETLAQAKRWLEEQRGPVPELLELSARARRAMVMANARAALSTP